MVARVETLEQARAVRQELIWMGREAVVTEIRTAPHLGWELVGYKVTSPRATTEELQQALKTTASG